jgi:hypothetical protein
MNERATMHLLSAPLKEESSDAGPHSINTTQMVSGNQPLPGKFKTSYRPKSGMSVNLFSSWLFRFDSCASQLQTSLPINPPIPLRPPGLLRGGSWVSALRKIEAAAKQKWRVQYEKVKHYRSLSRVN